MEVIGSLVQLRRDAASQRLPWALLRSQPVKPERIVTDDQRSRSNIIVHQELFVGSYQRHWTGTRTFASSAAWLNVAFPACHQYLILALSCRADRAWPTPRLSMAQATSPKASSRRLPVSKQAFCLSTMRSGGSPYGQRLAY